MRIIMDKVEFLVWVNKVRSGGGRYGDVFGYVEQPIVDVSVDADHAWLDFGELAAPAPKEK